VTSDKKTTSVRRTLVQGAGLLSFATGILLAGAVLLAGCKPSGDGASGTSTPPDATNHSQGFTYVEYFPAPNQTRVKTRLSGAEAQPLPGGLLVIKQARLGTFNTNGSPQAMAEAPECVYDTVNRTANSAGHLWMQSGDGRIRIEGDGFLWRQDDSFLTISNHVDSAIKTSVWKQNKL
jgi:hypothetical protein